MSDDTNELLARWRAIRANGRVSAEVGDALAAALERDETAKDEARETLGTIAKNEIQRLREVLETIQAVQPLVMERLRSDGVVFDEMPHYDPSNWQQVAFSIYTELCMIETLARTALGDRYDR